MRKDVSGMDVPCHMLLREGDGVLCHHCLAGRRVSGHKDRVTLFEVVDSVLLEGVQFEGILWDEVSVVIAYW